MLGEATVKASRIMMVMKGDTLVYNAAAFQLSEGSMLDQLVRQLPGVELRDGGRIYVNGRYAESLLVNGRDFFAGDPKVALDNLPAYTVDRVKVYEKAADDAYLDHPKDTLRDKRKPLVVDVQLKREYAQGWIANAEGGYGTRDRYLARLFGLRYTDHSSLAVFANFNNTNDTRTPGSRGDWSPAWTPQGLLTLKMGGLDFHVDSRRHGTKYHTSLRATQETTDNHTERSTTDFLPGGDVHARRRSLSHSRQERVWWNQTFTLPAPNFFFEIRPNVEYLHARHSGSDLAAQFTGDPLDSYRGAALDSVFRPAGSLRLDELLVNRTEQSVRGEQTTWAANGRAYLRRRSRLTGNTMSLTLNGNWADKDYTTFSHYDLRYAAPAADNDFRNRHELQPAMNYDYSARLNYEWTLSRIQFLIDYDYRQTYSSGQRSLFRLDRLEGWGSGTEEELGRLPSASGWEQAAIDAENSYHTVNRSYIHQPQLTVNFGRQKTTGAFMVRLPLRLQHDRIADRRAGREAERSRRVTAFEPFVAYRRGNLYITYQYTERELAMSYLLDVRDDADPLAVWLGNATLKPTQRHSARLNYQRLSAKHSWNVGAGYNLQRRAIGQAMDYDPATGAYTYQPRNIDGNWDASLDGGANGPLRNPKFRYSTSTQLRYANSVDFVSEAGANGQRSSVRNLNVGETLRFDYRYGQVHVGAQARASYTRATSRRADFATINCVDFDYGLTLTAPLVWDIELATDLTLFSRRGYDDASMNDNCLVWNASLSRSFGRKKDWTLRADGFDILRQLSSVRRTLTAQGRTETWYNTVPSYFMVRLMYRIHVLPK